MSTFAALAALMITAAGDEAPARAAFIAGQDLFRAGKFEAAVTEFEKAYALKPHASIFFNIARCHEELGHVPAALKAYRTYLLQRPDAADREEVGLSIAALERKLKARNLQQLMVVAEPAGSLVTVDGNALGKTPVFTELGAGDHTLRIEKTGLATISRTFTMSTQKSMQLSYVLQPAGSDVPAVDSPAVSAAEPAHSASEAVRIETTGQVSREYPWRRYAWIPVVATAAGAGAAAAGFVIAGNSARALDQELAAQKTVTGQAQTYARDGQAGQILAWSGVGLAAAGAVTSILFLAMSEERAVTASLSIAPGSAGLGLTGVFP